jgi:hypothetical protein|tara:strand:+ start:178 stop:336 length:159 start_codon:yes stop_codon:yes gene_type:complete
MTIASKSNALHLNQMNISVVFPEVSVQESLFTKSLILVGLSNEESPQIGLKF